MINTLIGGGILALPFTFIQSGLILGFTTLFITLILGIQTLKLLIDCKYLCGGESYAAIGYACYGKASIYIVNIAIAIVTLGMPVSYFIIFADAAEPLIRDLLQFDHLRKLIVVGLAVIIGKICF